MLDLLIHPDLRQPGARGRALGALARHGAGAVLGSGAVLAILLAAGPLNAVATLVAVFLIALPLLTALMVRGTGSLGLTDGLGLMTLAGLISFLALMTGGVASPFLIWMGLVPFAALTSFGRRGLAAGLAALVAVMALVVFLPPVSMVLPVWAPMAIVMGGAVYGAVLAMTLVHNEFDAAVDAAMREDRYRVLVDGAPEALLHIRGTGRIKLASPATRDLLGLAPDSLRGQSLTDFATGEDRRRLQHALARTTYFGNDSAVTFRLAGEDEAPRFLELNCRPILPPQERRSLLRWASKARKDAASFETIAILRDVTEHQRALSDMRAARDDANDANQAKSRFLANMSHELRTPLNSIIGFSEMMMSEVFGPLGNPRYQEYVLHIKQGGEHLRDLINDVLDMSKIEAGRYDLEIEDISVPRLLEDTLTTVSVTARKKKIELGIDMPNALPPLAADRRAVKQMLLNVLANAIKFTPQGGKVTTAVAREKDMMHFAISDTGVGIPSEDLSRLTLPFEQAATHGSMGEEGTGLGLALVRALAELHGGTLRIESVEGAGTTVHINLPLSQLEAGGEGTVRAVPLIRTRQAA